MKIFSSYNINQDENNKDGILAPTISILNSNKNDLTNSKLADENSTEVENSNYNHLNEDLLFNSSFISNEPTQKNDTSSVEPNNSNKNQSKYYKDCILAPTTSETIVAIPNSNENDSNILPFIGQESIQEKKVDDDQSNLISSTLTKATSSSINSENLNSVFHSNEKIQKSDAGFVASNAFNENQFELNDPNSTLVEKKNFYQLNHISSTFSSSPDLNFSNDLFISKESFQKCESCIEVLKSIKEIQDESKKDYLVLIESRFNYFLKKIAANKHSFLCELKDLLKNLNVNSLRNILLISLFRDIIHYVICYIEELQSSNFELNGNLIFLCAFFYNSN